jgi:hypothetical protein
MREVLGAFNEKQTVDSLGLGMIRDSFANQLVPGTSTIQTRARYFLFVPWIFGSLERNRVSPAKLWHRSRDAEVRLIEALRGIGPSQGVIGYRARSKVQRLPSIVYWNGLSTFGIRRLALSLEDYRRSLPSLYSSLDRIEFDDDRQRVGHVPSFWDPSLPGAPAGFPDAPSDMELTYAEAAYLSDKIVSSCPGTLLSASVVDPGLIKNATYPWDVAQESLSPATRELLHHGRCFSDVMHGAQLIYNLLLALRGTAVLGVDTSVLKETTSSALASWAMSMGSRREVVTEWFKEEAEFWSVVERMGPVPLPTKRFVCWWIARALRDPVTVGDDPEVQSVIVNREVRLKGKLARLSERRPLENWQGAAFGREQLNYRWPRAVQHVSDIAAGLERARAAA